MQISMINGVQTLVNPSDPSKTSAAPLLSQVAGNNNAQGSVSKGSSQAQTGGDDSNDEIAQLTQKLQQEQAQFRAMQQSFQPQPDDGMSGLSSEGQPPQATGALSAKSTVISLLERRLDQLMNGGAFAGSKSKPLTTSQKLSFLA
jgi:hypothetical protein